MTRAPQQRLQQSEEFFQSGISNHDDTTSGAAHARSLAALAGRSEGTLPWRKLDVLTFVLGPVLAEKTASAFRQDNGGRSELQT
jgi:hypothetical protein